MDVRVTPQLIVSQTIAEAQQQYDQLAIAQQQASTGRRILQPSDDPFALLQVLSAQAQSARLGAYQTNISDAQAKLNDSVSTLTQAGQLVAQAKDLALQGGNSVNDPTALQALGQQVDSILKQIINIANTQHNGQYLYGGTSTQTAPFQVGSNGQVTYVGAEQRANSPIGPGQSVDTYYSGDQIFQAQQGGTAADTFQVLATLRDALLNTQGLSDSEQQAAVSQTLGALDQVHTNILAAVGEQSASLQSLTAFQQHLQNVQLQAQQQVSNLDGADLSQVFVNLQSQQNLLQLTLASSSRILSQSLLDFLK